ncbi:FAD-dependent monooxygenase [Kineosporia babensis]|uniref:FAD-dependent monooxygenase n=1 Tax=Kineosporia babensis TaxID=499548 RepID=A0A9X1NKQ8_9ACTN|nr:FAD-dependent monooxygenase [Kineosporia babensis]MCD5315953.1 FAD-dependent monooxygenase [Kineosporia babensis]
MATDVIVVGAGPVGLMLAGELRLQGVSVLVLDRLAAPARQSRGASFTRRTAETFDQRGLLERLGTSERADAHFGGVPLNLEDLPEDHYAARGVPQYRTERMLQEWATELGAELRRGCEVTDFEQRENDVLVRFQSPAGPQEVQTAYLVGCDGARSIVRRRAGVGFAGRTPSRGFLTADVTGISTRRRRIGENLPDGSMIMAMDLENDVTRVVVHEHGMGPQDRDTIAFPDLADAWQRLTGESIHHGNCRWLGCFSDASRVAEHYAQGRVFLAGDAAHVQPPAMAQGLSVGIQDAVNLGWKIGAVVRREAPAALLETYESERLPVGRQLARNATAAIELRLSGPQMQPLREVMTTLAALPEATEHLAQMLSGLGVRYDMGPGQHPLLGRRVPPQWELVHQGQRVRLTELLRSGRGLLVSADPAAAQPWSDRVDLPAGTWARGGEGMEGLLIRPDGYVAWAGDDQEDGLTQALERWFGPALLDRAA